MAFNKRLRREKIKQSIRSKVEGSSDKPRMSVFRSNKHISVQIINDETGATLASATSSCKEMADFAGNKTEQAKKVGEMISKAAAEKGISTVIYDRNGYLFHGRVKALADAAREGGLKF